MGLGHSPAIISEGLVFYFDPINTRSYAGTGLTGYNLIDTTATGSLVGGAVYDVANKGSIFLDGVNDYINFATQPISNNNSISISCWVKFATIPSTFIPIVDAGNFGGGTSGYCIAFDNTNKIYMAINSGFTNINFNFNTNTWYNITGTAQQGTPYSIKVYVNGVEAAIGSSGASNSLTGINSNIRIGSNFVGTITYLNSNIASLSIYNRALSSTEVLQNYNATKKRFSPEENIVKEGLVLNFDAGNPNSYAGTGITAFSTAGVGYTAILNGPTFTSTNGGGFVFDNTFKYISLPSIIDSNNDLTVSFWNRRLATGSTHNLLHGVNQTNYFQIRYNSLNAVQLVKSNIADMGSFTGYTSTANNDVCLTVRFTKSSNTYDLFINGAYISSITNAQTFITSGPILGSGFPGSEHFNGYIYSFTYYNRVLTSTEILQNYNALKGRYGLS